jgi:phosphoribosylanthranilate isomerase
MKLKVCGITQLQQLKELDDLGVDFVGLIFYSQSLRCVTNKLKAEDVKSLSVSIKKVGVFVNADQKHIIDTVDNFGLDIVQLHGDETPEFCNHISSLVTVIKAFRITRANEQNIDWMIKPYEEFCDYYLFDTNRKNAYGGTGEKFDWELLKENKINKPFFLSGGIGSDDIEKVIAFTHPFFYALDINSKVEIEPGVKDFEKIKKILEGIKK